MLFSSIFKPSTEKQQVLIQKVPWGIPVWHHLSSCFDHMFSFFSVEQRNKQDLFTGWKKSNVFLFFPEYFFNISWYSYVPLFVLSQMILYLSKFHFWILCYYWSSIDVIHFPVFWCQPIEAFVVISKRCEIIIPIVFPCSSCSRYSTCLVCKT